MSRTRRRHFGAVRQLGSGRWQARYRDSRGELRSAPDTFPTKTDATRWLTLVEADIARGEWLDPRLGRVPFWVYADRWTATTAHFRPSTRDLYAYLLRKQLLPTFGDTDVGKITPVDVQAWLAERHASGLNPNTVAKAYRLLRSILDSAVETGLIARSPCTVKGAGTERHTDMRTATPDQVAQLAEAVGPRWRALVLTAAYSGLRWGELAGLRRRHFDPLRRRVTVAEQLTEVNGRLTLGPTKSDAGRRTLSLPDTVVDALVEHMSSYSEPGPDGLVFPATEGGPLRRSNFRRRVWEPVTQSTGLTGLRFHDLRHTGSTLAAAGGAPLRALMHRMGHSTAAAALRYQHLVAGQDEAIAAHLGDLARSAADTEQPAATAIQSGTFVARRSSDGSPGARRRARKAR